MNSKPSLAFAGLAAILAACASGPDAPGGLTAQAPAMQVSERLPATVVWRQPGLDPTRYTRFVVAPVKVYGGPDADFGTAGEADKQAMAAFMQKEFSRILAERFPSGLAGGAGTARLELTLAGMSDNVPVASTAATVLPFGMARNVAVGGQSAMLSGSVTYKGELYDTQTGKLLAAFVTSKTPSALDVAATISNQAAQQAAVTESARDLRDAITAAQQQAAARPGGR